MIYQSVLIGVNLRRWIAKLQCLNWKRNCHCIPVSPAWRMQKTKIWRRNLVSTVHDAASAATTACDAGLAWKSEGGPRLVSPWSLLTAGLLGKRRAQTGLRAAMNLVENLDSVEMKVVSFRDMIFAGHSCASICCLSLVRRSIASLWYGLRRHAFILQTCVMNCWSFEPHEREPSNSFIEICDIWHICVILTASPLQSPRFSAATCWCNRARSSIAYTYQMEGVQYNA